MMVRASIALALCLACGQHLAQAQTVFRYELLRMINQTIRPDDPSTLVGVQPKPDTPQQVFDRRAGGLVWIFARMFEATFDDGQALAFAVNPEFNSDEALEAVQLWAFRVGQWPHALRAPMERFVIHKGDRPMAGGQGNVTVHVGWPDSQGERVEELLMHEAAHAGYQDLQRSIHWRLAQRADSVYISTHAAEFPTSEDVAATFPAWVAVRFRADRLDAGVYKRIVEGVPNRLAVLDGLELSPHPMAATSSSAEGLEIPRAMRMSGVFPNPAVGRASIELELERPARAWVRLVDLLGRERSVWWRGLLEPGTHRLSGGLPNQPGIYWVVVEAAGRREVSAVAVVH